MHEVPTRWQEFIYESSTLIGLHIKMFLQMLHPHQTTELPLCRSSAKDHLVCYGCKPFGRHLNFYRRPLLDYVVLHLLFCMLDSE